MQLTLVYTHYPYSTTHIFLTRHSYIFTTIPRNFPLVHSPYPYSYPPTFLTQYHSSNSKSPVTYSFTLRSMWFPDNPHSPSHLIITVVTTESCLTHCHFPYRNSLKFIIHYHLSNSKSSVTHSVTLQLQQFPDNSHSPTHLILTVSPHVLFSQCRSLSQPQEHTDLLSNFRVRYSKRLWREHEIVGH